MSLKVGASGSYYKNIPIKINRNKVDKKRKHTPVLKRIKKTLFSENKLEIQHSFHGSDFFLLQNEKRQKQTSIRRQQNYNV